MKNGITLTDYTVIGITMVDSNQVGHDLTGFELQFRAFNGATQITGENPLNFLPLSEIEVEASDNGIGTAPGVIIFNDGLGGPQELDQVFKNCVEYTEAAALGAPVFNSLDAASHQINISYRCGDGGSLLGMPADYYSVEIEFQLIPTGPGF
ncbi:hypothetical protein KFE98_04180 [bacterium SCSIO 12741]|nr:hypothetical protein KFE98_04180 [bacterium SCSIO 12741]